MQFIILLLLSSSIYAKNNWCEFDSEFAEKYMEARKNYAGRLTTSKAEKWSDPSDYDYGSKRTRTYGVKWQEVSIKQQARQLFGDKELTFVAKENGKMVIYSKDIAAGEPMNREVED
jgi:hypothetical protein